MRNFYPLCKSFKVLSASLTLILLLASLYCLAQELFYADKPEDVQKRLSSLSDPGRSLENGQVYIKSFYEKGETGLRKSLRIKVAEGGNYHLAVHVLSTRNVPLTETEAGKLCPLQKITVYVDGQDAGLQNNVWAAVWQKGVFMMH